MVLPEDVIECRFYSTSLQTNWEQLYCDINKLISTLTSNYLWHQDKFKVELPFQHELDSSQYLISSTCFGENIEDEWYIVYLVLEVTKHFDHVVVQLTDNDDQFLLIEAANYLPKWIKPDNIENRVYVYRGSLHIITPELIGLNKIVKVEHSIKLIHEYSSKTRASDKIQSTILKRIGNGTQDLHSAVVKLPADLATILKIKPFFISHLVDAYCNHQIIDSTNYKNGFLYDVAKCIQVKVMFTKCLYAMLINSKFIKPKSSIAINKNDKGSVLGYKLTCGFNIIMDNLAKESSKQKNFSLFLKNLKQHGYFKENIEGSNEYKNLLEKAKTYYRSTAHSSEAEIARDIVEIMSTEDFFKQKVSLNICSDLQDDNDDWMNIQPDQLNDMLKARYGKQVNLDNDMNNTPEILTKEISRFLHQTSDIEGIVINEPDYSDDLIEFDENGFAESLAKMLNIVAPRELQDELGTASSSDAESDIFNVEEENSEMDQEISMSLATDIIGRNIQEKSKIAMENIITSLQEERGSAGPASNILKNIEIRKNNLLDSDDDSE